MEGKTWAESVDKVVTVEKDGEKFERIIKHVGPIWGQHEAADKVAAYMTDNGMNGWTWTGAWNSEEGTSYAQFERKQVDSSSSSSSDEE